ncbi:hypothetical protein [Tateyamaria sp. ANG-S1]|uniref:hypothetical protein n=1 Tax=Tateyamaria sp. ANG-S1 TaxID=1577905 RepID=UPI00068E35AF|nr:hypothetical protein [Tateyamaria sp. ANG-S1]
MHAWAYLPDMARAMVALAERRFEFHGYEEFGFGGYALTGDALIAMVEEVMGKPMRVSRLQWWAVRIIALWSPLMREVLEMRYQWDRPHQIDGSKLRATLPDFRDTPAREALAMSLSEQTGAYGD